MNREHYECIESTGEYPEPQDVYKFDNCFRELVKSYGEERISKDFSDKSPYSYKDAELLVKMRNTGKVVPFTAESKLVSNLKRIYQLRAYAEPSIAGEARKLYTSFKEE